MKKFFRKEVKIGLAGLAALFILITGINYLKGVNLFKPSNSIYIRFKDVNGLVKSSRVFADGFQIGIVSDILYDYNRVGNVVAEISLDPQLHIPKGSTALLSTSLLGDSRLNIVLNPHTTEKCASGDTIQGSISNGVMEQASALIPQIEQMTPKLDSILSSLNRLLSSPALANTLQNAEAISGNLVTTTNQLNKLLNNDIPALTGKLNIIGQHFESISAELDEINYLAAMQRIDSTLADVRKVTDKLNRTDNNLGLLLNDRQLYNNLNAVSSNAASLLNDLQTHPKRYVHFSLFGRKEKAPKSSN